MEINQLKDHIDTRLDLIEGKLDNHLERISKVEVNQAWIKHGFLAVLGWIVSTFFGTKP